MSEINRINIAGPAEKNADDQGRQLAYIRAAGSKQQLQWADQMGLRAELAAALTSC